MSTDASESPPMDVRTLRIFMTELVEQIERTDRAHTRMVAALGGSVDGRIAGDPTLNAYDELQNFLSAAGTVSRFAFPARDRADSQRRGAAVMKALHLVDSQILKSRYVRDRFEHIDERLDDFVRDNPPGTPLIDKNIGPVSAGPSMVGDPNATVLRNIDPDRAIASYREYTIDLEQLWRNVMELLPRANRWLAETRRPSPPTES